MYYRNYEITFGRGITHGVRNLIILNVLVYIVQQFHLLSVQYFGLVPAFVIHKLFLWQLVSYMFLHGNLMHIVMNMFVLWMFGTEIERNWSTREFYKYYFITGIGAGIFNIIFEPGSVIPIIGASGAIYGLLLAYGLLFPNQPILIYFLFPIKAKYFVLIFGLLTFISAFSSNDNIAHFAHLGGMVVGYLYLRLDWRLQHFFSFTKLRRLKYPHLRVHRHTDDNKDDISRKIDTILDKINSVGYQNLTEEEKELLRKASKYFLDRNGKNDYHSS
jgi:membrane associated rhomboid family serine protease